MNKALKCILWVVIDLIGVILLVCLKSYYPNIALDVFYLCTCGLFGSMTSYIFLERLNKMAERRLTYKEAANRLKEFGLHHVIQDLPHSSLTVEAFEMVIEACNKQEPIKVLNRSGYPNNGFDTAWGECPKCRQYVQTITPRYYIANNLGYCPQCGQHLDWSIGESEWIKQK